jgi:hypothetical protein
MRGSRPPKTEDVKTSTIIWEGVADISADEALAATSTKKDTSGARMFLMDMLANGPVPATLIEELAAMRGLSIDQLKRAKPKMGVGSFRKAMDKGWFWALPQHMPAAEGGRNLAP